MNEQELKKLIDEHWEWVSGLLKLTSNIQDIELDMMEYLYRTAFLHGYKHAKDEK